MKCNNAGRKPVFSAKPIPSIPTKTIPSGGKSIKLLTIDDNNHHTPSEDKRFLTITKLLLWSVIEKLNFETIIDKANIKNAVFTGSMIFRSQFYKANITGADFSNTNLAESEFEYATTKNVKWKNAKFCKTRFTNDLKNEGCTGRYRVDPSVYPKEKTEMDRLIDKWEKLYATCRGEYGKVREIACRKIWNVQDKLRGMNLCKGRYNLYNVPNASMMLRRTWLPCRYKRLIDG